MAETITATTDVSFFQVEVTRDSFSDDDSIVVENSQENDRETKLLARRVDPASKTGSVLTVMSRHPLYLFL